jgi:hypothetical protein
VEAEAEAEEPKRWGPQERAVPERAVPTSSGRGGPKQRGPAAPVAKSVPPWGPSQWQGRQQRERRQWLRSGWPGR